MTARPEPELPPLHESLTWLTPLSEERAAGLVEFVADPEPADVLDLGCGWGPVAIVLLRLVPPRRRCSTIDTASVYPREVLKATLAYNAAAVILVHNHPSGDPEPSDSDRRITERLKEALELMDIKVIDHVVVASEGCQSFAELGYL